MLRACGFVGRTSFRHLAARAGTPVAACVGGYLNTLRPAPDSSSLQLPVLHLSWAHSYHDERRKPRLQAKAAAAAAVVCVKPQAPAPAPAPPPAGAAGVEGKASSITSTAAAAASEPAVEPAPAVCSTNAAVDALGALQEAPPLPRVLYSSLPRLMEAYKQGLLRPGAVPADLDSSLLPNTEHNRSQGYVVNDHDLWFVPSKPMSQFDAHRGLKLYAGDWMGLVPGAFWQGPTAVLVPCGPQQQQQQVPCAGLDMPGDWRVAASTTGTLRCHKKGRTKKHIVLSSHLLWDELRLLAADHSLLRAHVHQGTLYLYLAPSCFLQHPWDAPLLEQLLQSQLHDLAAGVPLAQWLATTQKRTWALSHPGAAWWCPFPLIDNKVSQWGFMGLPGGLWDFLALPGCRSVMVPLQIVGPTAAAAAALQSLPLLLPNGGQHVSHRQQCGVDVDAAVSIFTCSAGMLWEVLHEEHNMRFLENDSTAYLSSKRTWRHVLDSFGGWHLFKARAVPPGVIRLYLLPPWAFAQDCDSTSGDDSSISDTDGSNC